MRDVQMKWPKHPINWIVDGILHVSIPFTWNLPEIRKRLMQRGLWWDKAIVGGPAVQLLPDFFSDLDFVEIGSDWPGILQRINPMATRTTTGCVRKCKFCGIGVGKIESGGFRELEDWPHLPVLCDNNLLAASQPHFDKVINHLKKHSWCDFNQGLDIRLLTRYHAERIAELSKPKCRFALDTMSDVEGWQIAVGLLRRAGIPRSHIHSYCLIGWRDSPVEAWKRCKWVASEGIHPYPMWYHRLDAMEYNTVTLDQTALGWTKAERQRIMKYYYPHYG